MTVTISQYSAITFLLFEASHRYSPNSVVEHLLVCNWFFYTNHVIYRTYLTFYTIFLYHTYKQVWSN